MHTNMGVFHKHDVESKKSGIEEYDSVYVDLFKLICDLDVRIMLILREILTGRGHKWTFYNSGSILVGWWLNRGSDR